MWWIWRKGDSGFSSSSTAEEVTDGIDGSGLTAIVTGGASGIGAETVRVLALRSVHVIMGVRNTAAGKKVKEAILEKDADAKIDVMELDLSSLASVNKFASNFISLSLPLNILINNAGVLATQFMLSKDDIELQFATNHLGHFLLTNLLLDTMKKTSIRTKREGRVVNVTSVAHKMVPNRGEIHFDKIIHQTGYDKSYAYQQSKLANILHANELARRFKEEGVEITANSVHPGTVTTSLFRDNRIIDALIKLFKYVVKNVEQGAATTCYVALHPQVKGISGEYFSDSKLDKASSQATDVDLARKLWDFSDELVVNKSTIPCNNLT